MQILSYGFKLPEDGDFGDVWFPALAFDIQQLNDHTHNGLNSPLLAGSAIIAQHSTLLSTAFIDQGDGYWRAEVTLPSGMTYDGTQIFVREPVSGDTALLRIAPKTQQVAYIYTNFVQTFEVYFLT